MKNGQLKPAYNLKVSSNIQYITHYSIHQATTDTTALKKHLADFTNEHQIIPTDVRADAGYGSEKNYRHLVQNIITAYVKRNQFDRERNENIQSKKPFTADKLHYNKEEDCYGCPIGQHMENKGSYSKTTATGFMQRIKKYEAKNRQGYPLNGSCHKSKGNKVLEINHRLNELKTTSQ